MGSDVIRWDKKTLSFGDLESLVVRPDLCYRCAACEAVCPVDVIDVDINTSEGARLVGICIECQLCPLVCSVLNPYEAPLEKPLGNYIEYGIYKASEMEIWKNATDGGVTTALLEHAFEIGMIDGAIVSVRDEEWYVKPIIVTEAKELRKYSKTYYWHVPVFKPLKDAINKMKLKKIAVVGTGCNIASAKLLDRIPKFRGKVVLKLGLLCSKTYRREEFFEIIKNKLNINPKEIKDILIKKRLIFRLHDGNLKELSLDEVENTTFGSCYVCHDFTAEESDISLGSNGAPEGWNFVIIRTQIGKQLIESALNSGKIVKSNEKPKVKFVIKRSIEQKLRGIPQHLTPALLAQYSK